MKIVLELVIFFGCILLGARLGGIALGTIAGIGLAIFVFIFALPPGGPPPGVLGMIIAVITALATMQAAGGLAYLRLNGRHAGSADDERDFVAAHAGNHDSRHLCRSSDRRLVGRLAGKESE